MSLIMLFLPIIVIPTYLVYLICSTGFLTHYYAANIFGVAEKLIVFTFIISISSMD
jgi:hypothetical protein